MKLRLIAHTEILTIFFGGDNKILLSNPLISLSPVSPCLVISSSFTWWCNKFALGRQELSPFLSGNRGDSREFIF